jgi:predicted nucleic acid-binding protein
MKVIDSSLWIEFFIGTNYGLKVIELLENEEEILIPTIVITEVYKKFLNDSTIEIATTILRKLSTFQVVVLDLKLSALSATFGKEYKLPIADSIIYSTAINFNASLYTLDKHFQDLPNVKYFEKN